MKLTLLIFVAFGMVLIGLVLYVIIFYGGNDFDDPKPHPSYSWAIILIIDFLCILPSGILTFLDARGTFGSLGMGAVGDSGASSGFIRSPVLLLLNIWF